MTSLVAASFNAGRSKLTNRLLLAMDPLGAPDADPPAQSASDPTGFCHRLPAGPSGLVSAALARAAVDELEGEPANNPPPAGVRAHAGLRGPRHRSAADGPPPHSRRATQASAPGKRQSDMAASPRTPMTPKTPHTPRTPRANAERKRRQPFGGLSLQHTVSWTNVWRPVLATCPRHVQSAASLGQTFGGVSWQRVNWQRLQGVSNS